MKLAASLLALVAAAPTGCVSACFGFCGGRRARALAQGIQEHIKLAELTVNFVANNFENPPTPESRDVRGAAFLVTDHGKVGIAEYNSVPDLMGKLLPFRSLRFKSENFVGPDDRRVHALCEGTPNRAKRLWSFYKNIWTFLNPRAAARSSPPVPDILRSVDSDGPNLEAEFTNNAVRDFLASVASELSNAARQNVAQSKVGDWMGRLHYLDSAISDIHLYEHDPFSYHTQLLWFLRNNGDSYRASPDLQNYSDSSPEWDRPKSPDMDANSGRKPVVVFDPFFSVLLDIKAAANAAKRAYS